MSDILNPEPNEWVLVPVLAVLLVLPGAVISAGIYTAADKLGARRPYRAGVFLVACLCVLALGGSVAARAYWNLRDRLDSVPLQDLP